MAFKWKVVHDGKTPPPGEVVAARRAAVLGADGRDRRPARHRDVRRDVRLPARDGAGPEPRDHDVRRRHHPVPAHHPEPGAQLPGHQRLLRRRCVRDPGGAGRPTAPSPARSWSPAWSSRAVGIAISVLGIGVIHRRLPAGGHRRRGHADRLRTGLRGRRRVLAAGPLGRADHHARAVPDDRAAARASGAASRSCSALVFGFVLSWVLDKPPRATSPPSTQRPAEVDTHPRVSFAAVEGRRLDRLPGLPRLRTSSSPRSCWCCRP